MSDPEERLRAVVQPVLDAAENALGWKADVTHPSYAEQDRIDIERAAILACARAQVDVLRTLPVTATSVEVPEGEPVTWVRLKDALAAAEALMARLEGALSPEGMEEVR